MAEGQMRLNRQVVDRDAWEPSERVTPSARQSGSYPMSLEDRDRRLDGIRRAVEAEIIPRVAVGHGPLSAIPHGGVSDEDVTILMGILLHANEDVALTHIQEVLGRGIAPQYLYLHLFQPAARRIGELWCDDLCTFVDVTLAVGTLQKALRVLSPLFRQENRPACSGRHAVLTAMPGDQHTFGLSMVGEFFRRAGWTLSTVPFGASDALDNALRGDGCAVVGFSASTVGQLDAVAAAIRQARRACRRPIAVLVGGPLFVAHPEYAIRVGADALGLDAGQALARAESFAVRTAGS